MCKRGKKGEWGSRRWSEFLWSRRCESNSPKSTFRWALTCGHKVPIEEGLEHPELPDGTGEFLDAWLMLLENG
ncbi:hypothetical protein CEXT_385471 [Caerostris extrusa]|uniref:Uncharacterized protein n=1 Tax=Caerostris extrusa TaxID=172846 RepID=A0AAV4RG60_CAEEX|nr:hypothetical protein CEXT_385471 [Caerostris extrusa]